jgi:hypothetical protein
VNSLNLFRRHCGLNTRVYNVYVLYFIGPSAIFVLRFVVLFNQLLIQGECQIGLLQVESKGLIDQLEGGMTETHSKQHVTRMI